MSSDLKKTILKVLNDLPDGNILCHGDFHPDNILMNSNHPIIIDWIDATKGAPDADISRTLLLLQKGQPQYQSNINQEEDSLRTQFIKHYLRRYSEIRSISIDNVKLWQLPVIAARLSEGIKEEKSELLSILKTLVQHHETE